MGKFNHRSDWQHKQKRQETKCRSKTARTVAEARRDQEAGGRIIRQVLGTALAETGEREFNRTTDDGTLVPVIMVASAAAPKSDLEFRRHLNAGFIGIHAVPACVGMTDLAARMAPGPGILFAKEPAPDEPAERILESGDGM